MVLALGAAACAPAATPTVTPTRIRPTRTLTPAAPTPAWATPTAAPALTITLAKLERKGDEVRVWIAFRKAGPASGRASFHLNIRDDRGNTYPSDPYTVDLSVPDIRFVVDRMDLALLPVGFTWVSSATVEMPAIAPIHSILVYGDPLEHGVSLDPQSAKWPTIDLDVVRKNDLTGKKFKLSRDINVWFGQPAQQEEGQRFGWRIPVFIQNEDYNPRGVPLKYIHYFLYFPSGEIMFLPVDTWSSEVISGVDLDGQNHMPTEVPPIKTIKITHMTKFTDPFKDRPTAIMVEMAGMAGYDFKMLGFLPLEELLSREPAKGYIQDIRSVNFNNFTFLSVECWGGQRVERLEVRNGKAEVVLGSSELDRFQFFVDTTYEDLTGDGHEEAVVSLRCIQPAINHPLLAATNYIYIYTVRNGSLALIATLTDKRLQRDIERYYNLWLWGHGEKRVSGGELVIERLAGFPVACPPYVASLRYRLEGDTLLLAGRPVVRYNPECKK
jgi:hypothetical protein